MISIEESLAYYRQKQQPGKKWPKSRFEPAVSDEMQSNQLDTSNEPPLPATPTELPPEVHPQTTATRKETTPTEAKLNFATPHLIDHLIEELLYPGTFPGLQDFFRKVAQPQSTYQNELNGQWARPEIREMYQLATRSTAEHHLLFPTQKPQKNSRISALCMAYAQFNRNEAMLYWRVINRLDTVLKLNLNQTNHPDAPYNLHALFNFLSPHLAELKVWLAQPNTLAGATKETALGRGIKLHTEGEKPTVTSFLTLARINLIQKVDFARLKKHLQLAQPEGTNRVGATDSVQLFEYLFCQVDWNDQKTVEQALQLPQPLSATEFAYLTRRIQSIRLVILGLLTDKPTIPPPENIADKVWRKIITHKPAPTPQTGPLQTQLSDGKFNLYYSNQQEGLGLLQLMVGCLNEESISKRHNRLQTARPKSGLNSLGHLLKDYLKVITQAMETKSQPLAGFGGAHAVLRLYSQERLDPATRGRSLQETQVKEIMEACVAAALLPFDQALRQTEAKAASSVESLTGLELELDDTTLALITNSLYERLKQAGESAKAEGGKLERSDAVMRFSQTYQNNSPVDQPSGEPSNDQTQTLIERRFKDLFFNAQLTPSNLERLFSLPANALSKSEALQAVFKRLARPLLLIIASLKEKPPQPPKDDLPIIDIFEPAPQLAVGGQFENLLNQLAGPHTQTALNSLVTALSVSTDEGISQMQALIQSGTNSTQESAQTVLQHLVNKLANNHQLAVSVAEKLFVSYQNPQLKIATDFADMPNFGQEALTKYLRNQLYEMILYSVLLADNADSMEKVPLQKLV